MQFLETIEGRSGEELTSAVLKFLLVNSVTMRECFVRRLRPLFPASRAPTFRDGIVCQTEVSTDDSRGPGRIDLVVREASGVVLGIENKFWASFTDDQPKKYWQPLVTMSGNRPDSCRLVLLVPKQRDVEIWKHLEAQQIEKNCCLLFWNDLVADLTEVACKDRTEVAAAAVFLKEYVDRQVIATQLCFRRDQLIGERVQIGNDFHYDCLYQLQTCLPNPERIRPARDWIGFAFRVIPLTDSSAYPKQWFGFMKPEGEDCVVMGIDTGVQEFDQLPQGWARNGVRFENGHAVVEIDYDESLKTPWEWKKRLDEILMPLADVIRASSGSSI